MKVVCISHKDHTGDAFPYNGDDPQIGDTCDVLFTTWGYGTGNIPVACYKLRGYNRWVYDKRNFAIVSSIDETELVNEKETVNA